MEEPYASDNEGGWVEVGSKKKPEKPKAGSSKAKKGNNKRLRENNPHHGKNGKLDRPSSSQNEPNYKTRSMRTVTPSLDSAVSVLTDITANMSKMSMDESAEDAATGSEVVAIVIEADPSPKADMPVAISDEPFSLHDFHILCSTISPESCHIQTFPTRGLINTKSECFRNCILQSLFSLPVFRNVITHLYSSINHRLLVDSVYWKEFLSFASHFFLDASQDKPHNTRLASSISASEQMPTLCTAFDQLMSQYNPSSNNSQNVKGKGRKRGGIQQDAMEFLTFFLDCLHEELLSLHYQIHQQSQQEEEEKNETAGNKSVTSNSTFLSSEQTLFLHRLQHIGFETTEEKSSEEEWNTVTRKTRVSVKMQVDEPSRQRAKIELFSTLISRLFHGLLRSEVSYKMKRVVSVTFQRFHCLTLDCLGFNPATLRLNPGLHPGGEVPLETVLSHYFSEETVDDSQSIKKCVKFEFLPPILILQLNRFSFDYSRNIAVKVGTRVAYPEKFEILPGYVSDSLTAKTRLLGGGKGCFYQLQSVVLHLGKKATGGHYISYTRDSVGHGWKAVDDVKVNVISEEFALSACATVYILFYTKIEEDEQHADTAATASAVGTEEKERS